MKSIDDLVKSIQIATKELEDAERALAVARNRETEAFNTLNTLHKKFDDTVTEFKKNAPKDTDWGRDATNRCA